MKRLSIILHQVSGLNFPVKGVNGYGGEQDGSEVLTALFGSNGEFGDTYVMSREAAQEILIPERAEIHWCEWSRKNGWIGSVGVWSNQVTPEELKTSSLEFI